VTVRRLKNLRRTVVAVVGVLVAYSSSSAEETTGTAITGGDQSQENPKPSWISQLASFRPLLGGFDDPVTGTHINGHAFVDGAAYANDKSGQFDNDINLRRARLTFRNGLLDDLTFKASAELSTNPAAIEIKDLYRLYSGLSWGPIVAGNRKEPFSLEQLTSSRYTTLMEKALPAVAMAPGRNVGVTIGALWNKRTTLTAGVFGSGFKEVGLRSSATALTGRATHLFVDEPEQLLHLGFSGAYRHVGVDRHHSIPLSSRSRNYRELHGRHRRPYER
jgi:phosphate-selective porin